MQISWFRKKRYVARSLPTQVPVPNEPILDILIRYPVNSWNFTFSETRIQSQWPLRASGTCINPKGASVTFEIYAPPMEAMFESGFVKITVDTICVYRQEWDGYVIGAGRNVREEVLASPFWKWIESRYQANLCFVEEARLNELLADAQRSNRLYGDAWSRL